jgi:hypothetical protein
VLSIIPDVFCRWSSCKVISLCGALALRCSVDGLPSALYVLCGALVQRFSVNSSFSTLWLCVDHKTKDVL